MNIAIVGGGPGGLIALYECKRRKINTTLYEKQSSLGGVWNLKTTEPRAHYSTLFNSSHFVSTFDMDNTETKNRKYHTNDYWTSSEYNEYLEFLNRSYDLSSNIMFNHDVTNINSRDNHFFVNVLNKDSKRTITYCHDHVIICTGRNGVEKIPTEPFLSKEIIVNKDPVWHSSYWDPLEPTSSTSKIVERENSKILVIGGSHSAAESIQDFLNSSRDNGDNSALKVYWAPTRQPDKRNAWMFDRYPYKGRKQRLPADESLCRLYKIVPSWIVATQLRKIATPIILYDSKALPNMEIDVFCLCDTALLSSAIKRGTIEILSKPVTRIYKADSGSIAFNTTDKSAVTVDAVVLATGYNYADMKINDEFLLATSKFYRGIIPLDEKLYGRVGFVGTSRIIGSSLAILQMEVRWLLYHWFTASSQWQSTLKQLQSKEHYCKQQGSFTEVPRIPVNVMDQLAHDMAVMPQIWTSLLSIYPRTRHLALACLLSPVSICQYRNLLESSQEKLHRENYLLLNTHRSFKRANNNFKLVCLVSDVLYYFGLAVIVFKFSDFFGIGFS